LADEDTSVQAAPTLSALSIGKYIGVGTNQVHLAGVYSRIRVWDVALNATEALAVYNFEKANYGFYAYGWPSGGSSESDVAAQWLFDEAAGDIVDEVASITCADAGTPTYSVLFAGSLFSALSPGITGGVGDSFSKAGAESALHMSTSDGVTEFVAILSSTPNGNDHIYDFRSGGKGSRMFYESGNTRMWFVFVSEDATTVSGSISTVADLADDLPHKHRAVLDRSGNIEYFVDGVSQGTLDMSTLDGKNIQCNAMVIMSNDVKNLPWTGTAAELRFTIGNITNNSGGPGGG
jgi:hypothetical protein